MARLLKGKEVAEAIVEDLKSRSLSLKEKDIVPTLAILRVGNKDEDISYEKGIAKRSLEIGIEVKNIILDENVAKEDFYQTLDKLNKGSSIHGILIFRPMPSYLDNELARISINPDKDVDGCSDASLTALFTNSKMGFAPCTAEAVIAILDHYGIPVQGRNVVVLGRSLVIGKPVSMLLLNRNATITICHTKTNDASDIASKADILICATGVMESVDSSYVNQDQTIIDVGISWNEKKNKLCGDVLFEEVESLVKDITPVPGGVGSVTTSILCRHVIEAAEKQI